MSDQERNELRVKVAELCGWKPYQGVQTIAYMWAPGHISNVVPKWTRTVADEVDFLIELPDYPRDLNAIQEAERAAFPDSVGDLILNDWAYNLYMECRANAEDKDVSLARATAEQRCRAFVLTMEKGEHHGR